MVAHANNPYRKKSEDERKKILNTRLAWAT